MTDQLSPEREAEQQGLYGLTTARNAWEQCFPETTIQDEMLLSLIRRYGADALKAGIRQAGAAYETQRRMVFWLPSMVMQQVKKFSSIAANSVRRDSEGLAQATAGPVASSTNEGDVTMSKTLRNSDKKLVVLFTEHPAVTGFSIREIAALSGLSLRTTARALQRLRERGLLPDKVGQ